MAGSDERDLVRRGYDALSYHYRSDAAGDGHYAPWLAALDTRLPAAADVVELDLPSESFDAVLCLYALIHMPVSHQPDVIQRISSWLRPGGWFLATTGHDAWTGTEDAWLGGPAAMWWSHADAGAYRAWIEAAGLTVTAQEFVPEGTGGHALFWARRPSG